jgi:hypothetical protein
MSDENDEKLKLLSRVRVAKSEVRRGTRFPFPPYL